MMLITRWQSAAPQLRSVLRIIAAFLFIQYGAIKLFGFPKAMPPGVSLPMLSQLWFAGVLEVFGGGLLLIGLFTRPVAFLLAGEMAIAYFQGHASHGFWPVVNGGIDAVFFCFLWLYFSAAGAGPWSVDAIRARPWLRTPRSR
jgi:putative oxidoreductase